MLKYIGKRKLLGENDGKNEKSWNIDADLRVACAVRNRDDGGIGISFCTVAEKRWYESLANLTIIADELRRQPISIV